MKNKNFLMSKLVTISVFVVCALIFMSHSVYAEVFKFECALGIWSHNPDGYVSYNGDNIELKDDLELGERRDWQMRFRVEHPVPLVPHLKVQYTPIEIHDESTIEKGFSFGVPTFTTLFPLLSLNIP